MSDFDTEFASFRGQKPQADGATFDDEFSAFRQTKEREQAALRTSVGAAMQTTPEQAAKVKYLSTVTGIDPSVIATQEGEVAARAKFQEIQKEAQFSPILQARLRDPEFTKLAIDDVPTLSKLEQGIGGVMQFVMGADGKGGLPGMVGRGAQKAYYGSVSGTSGAFRAASELVAPLLDPVENVQSIGGNPLRRLAEGFGLIAQGANASSDALKSPYDGNIAAGAESGFASIGQNAKYVPFMLAGPVGVTAALVGMSLETGGQSYQKAREKGVGQNLALAYGASDAVVEFATEKIPMHRLVGDVAANTSVLKTIAKQIGLEVPGEQIATALQDLNEWAVMHPEKTFGDYIAARPDAAVQTLVATVIGTGGNVAVGKALGTLMDAQVQRDYNDLFNAQRDAQDRATKLQDVMATAAGSKLRELSPETFREHVQAAADGQEGAPKSVHIDGQVLLQTLQAAGVTEEQLAQSMPSVVAQLAEAATANSTVEIPIGELATALPGTPLEQALLPHLRIGGPESLSQSEAEQAQQQAQEYLKSESERVMQESQDQVQWTQESEGIKSTIRDQLTATGRFSDDVNSKYATLVRDFYSVMASRTGMTPKAMYDLMPYKVGVRGQSGAVLDTMRQGGTAYPLAPQNEWYGEGTYKADGGRMVSMTPDEYLAAVRPLTMDDESRENIDLLKEHIQSGKTLDPLLIRANGKEDGRHRAYAAKELGIKSVPVIAYGDQFANASVYGQGALNQDGQAPKLMAVHNLSIDNLLYADKMGGLAVPSVGVVTDQAGGVEGFGEITLIGRREMVDPKSERVFSSDAYTMRFPRPEYAKAKSKDAMKLVEKVRAVSKEFDDRSLVDVTFDSMVNTPKPDEVVSKWLRSNATKALYLREQGVDVAPAMSPVRLESGLTVEQYTELRPLFDQAMAAGVEGSPEEKELQAKIEAALRENYKALGKREVLVDKLVSHAVNQYEYVMGKDARAVAAGPQVDFGKTSEALDAALKGKEAEFKAWVEDQIMPKFGEPFLKVGSKKLPYTLPNIVDAMTDSKVKGKEKTMTYGPGQVRAAASVEFSNLEQMREAAKTSIADPEAYKVAEEQSEKLLSDYREAVAQYTTIKNWRGEPDIWEAMDGSMRALAKWATSKKQDATTMKAALKAEDFNTSAIPAELIQQAITAGRALLDAPVPYFEAKPQRAVSLGEFAGAVVPASTPKEALDVLSKNGIAVKVLTPEQDRTQAAKAFAAELSAKGEQTLFQNTQPNKYQAKYLAGRDLSSLNAEERAQYDILATQVTDTPEFKNWFGDSKVVDADGKPLVVYHGTNAHAYVKGEIEVFNTRPDSGRGGAFFTSSKELADQYGEKTYATYLRMSKPLVVYAAGNGWTTLGAASKVSGPATDTLKAESGKAAKRMTDIFAELDELFDEKTPAVEASPKIGPNDTSLDGKTLGDLPGLDGAEMETDAVVKAARKLGFDGVIFKDVQDSPTADAGYTKVLSDVYAVFSPTQIKSATGNSGQFDPNNPSILAQPQAQGPRGTFNPSTLTTVLNENADLSTFLHETGHFFLEAMATLASQPNAAPGVVKDMNALLKWFGVPDLATWQGYTLEQQRQHHERFAESFELYLMEGKAPNTELAQLFRTFRAWLTRVYKSLSQFMEGRDLQFSDDIRQVMDRMLATEAQIAEAEKVAGLVPNLDATGEAIEQLQSRSIRDLKWAVNARNKFIKQLQQEAKAKRKEVEAEVTAEVDAMPEFAAKKALDDLRKATKEKPSDADLAAIADAHGFKDYESMLSAIDAVGKKADVIEGMTDQRMLERYGDLVDKDSIEQAATEAVHNAARAKSLATELAAQRELLNPRQDTGKTNVKGQKITVNALAEAAKQFAANVVGRKPVGELKKAAYNHLQAERRAAKAWEAATAKGDTKAAVQAKQDQMLNNATVRAANEAIDDAKKTMEFFAKVLKGNSETVVEKGRDADIVNAARAILAVYGVGAFSGKNAFEYMDLLKANDPSLFAVLDDSVRAAVASAKPVGKLTVDELTALKDEIASMWHLAKSSRQYEVDGDRMDIEDAAEELKARMEAKGVPAVMPGDFGAVTEAEKRGRSLQFAGALLRRVESWAEAMDGKFGGPFLKLVFQPVKAAADRYRADRAAYRKQFTALVENVSPSLKPGLIEAPELGYTFGKGKGGVGQAELLSAMLHLGNESNKRKLLLGRNWATENQDGTLDTSRWDAFMERMHNTGVVNKAHYDFAQGVWDLLESMKPLAQKTHRDVYGRYFAEVTADSFSTPFGSYTGGYFPALVDPEIVKDNEMRKLAEVENENMAYAFPATSKGFTKSRTEYNRPLMLDLRTLPQHIDKVLLFSHMEPAVRGVSKVLSQRGVSSMLGKIDPAAISGMLTPWLNRSARQIVETPIVGDGRVSRVLSVVRARAGMSVMFANLSNTVQQLAGLTLARVKIKSGYLTSAMAQYARNPKKMSDAVASASSFMATRMDDQIAALNGTVDEILLNPSVYESAKNWTAKHTYFLQSALDNVVGPVVWSAAYNQALAEGMKESDAVHFADGTVRQTQGSTLPEDVSRIETGPAYARMFTQFIGYFNMVANTNVTALQNIADDVGLKKGAGKALAVVFFGLLAPAWIAEAIAQAFKGGPDDEDKDGQYLDDWLMAVFGLGTAKTLLAGVPFVGQFAMAGVNTWNGKPYDDRTNLSPAVSMLEGAVGAPRSVYKALVENGSKQKAVRDVATAVSLVTGLPVSAAARPVGYLTGVAEGKANPTGPIDAARGVVTGTASPESKR